jgi:hypothetical protein
MMWLSRDRKNWASLHIGVMKDAQKIMVKTGRSGLMIARERRMRPQENLSETRDDDDGDGDTMMYSRSLTFTGRVEL